MFVEKSSRVHQWLSILAFMTLVIVCAVGSLSVYMVQGQASNMTSHNNGIVAIAPIQSPTPILPDADCPQKNPPDPCGLLSDLHWAINGIAGSAPHPNWEGHLDWTFNKWRNGSSQNLPLLSHAISLWKPAPGPTGGTATQQQKIDWWIAFFTYQLGECPAGQSCFPSWVSPATDPMMLKYLKGSELLSNHYDHVTTTAVATVHLWAFTNFGQSSTIASKAKKYLRATWALYTLGAGSSYAFQRQEYWDGETASTTVNCQLGSTGPFFDGPFLALAGMRADPGAGCQDDRGPLFIRAIDWVVTRNLREGREQKAVCDTIENKWPNQVNRKGVYGLIPDERTMLRNHITGTLAVDAIIAMLGTSKTSANYRLLGWVEGGSQVRASLVETNHNFNTSAVYAVRYKAASGTAEFLYPYNIFCATTCTCAPSPCPNRCNRSGITAGYAFLMRGDIQDPLNPDRIKASNGSSCVHGTRVVTLLGIPASGSYQVLLSPNAAAQKVLW